MGLPRLPNGNVTDDMNDHCRSAVDARSTFSFRLGSSIDHSVFDFGFSQRQTNAAKWIQGCSSALQASKQNDNACPHQWAASKFAGRYRLQPNYPERGCSCIVWGANVARRSALYPANLYPANSD